jgi:CubicO group peptidase (beta-lactamase class C family)
MRHPQYPNTPITIRILLSHQSALAHFTDQYEGYVKDKELLDWLSANYGLNKARYDPLPSYAEFLESYLTPN